MQLGYITEITETLLLALGDFYAKMLASVVLMQVCIIHSDVGHCYLVIPLWHLHRAHAGAIHDMCILSGAVAAPPWPQPHLPTYPQGTSASADSYFRRELRQLLDKETTRPEPNP